MDDDGNTQSELTTNARLTEKDITGLKYFEQIAPLLKRLHDDASDHYERRQCQEFFGIVRRNTNDKRRVRRA